MDAAARWTAIYSRLMAAVLFLAQAGKVHGELMELKEALRTMKKLMGKLEQREIL